MSLPDPSWNTTEAAPAAVPQLPDKWLPHVVQLLLQLERGRQLPGSSGLLQPRLRPVLEAGWPAALAAYSVLAVAGSAACLLAARAARRRPLPLSLLIASLANCCLVLPLTLTVLLLQNWVLGSTLCFLLPILQVRRPAITGAVKAYPGYDGPV